MIQERQEEVEAVALRPFDERVESLEPTRPIVELDLAIGEKLVRGLVAISAEQIAESPGSSGIHACCGYLLKKKGLNFFAAEAQKVAVNSIGEEVSSSELESGSVCGDEFRHMRETARVEIRPFTETDGEHCLALFDSNTPSYFAESERTDFEKFLANPDGRYFVLEHEGVTVGSGGYAIRAEHQRAKLVWGMVRADLHGHGLGRFLLLFRLREIGRLGHVEIVEIKTSQKSAPFFEKQGFKVIRVVPDEFGPGLHEVEMVKRLAVCT